MYTAKKFFLDLNKNKIFILILTGIITLSTYGFTNKIKKNVWTTTVSIFDSPSELLISNWEKKTKTNFDNLNFLNVSSKNLKDTKIKNFYVNFKDEVTSKNNFIDFFKNNQQCLKFSKDNNITDINKWVNSKINIKFKNITPKKKTTSNDIYSLVKINFYFPENFKNIAPTVANQYLIYQSEIKGKNLKAIISNDLEEQINVIKIKKNIFTLKQEGFIKSKIFKHKQAIRAAKAIGLEESLDIKKSNIYIGLENSSATDENLSSIGSGANVVNLNEPLYYRGQKILEVELENFSEDLKNIDLSEEYIGLDILEIALLDQLKQIKNQKFFWDPIVDGALFSQKEKSFEILITISAMLFGIVLSIMIVLVRSSVF